MQEIKKVDVLSVAMILGAMYAIMGFIIGIIFAIVGGAAMGSQQIPGVIGLFFGVFAIVLLPILYGVLGFVFGAIFAFLYNVLAGRIGGIKVELV